MLEEFRTVCEKTAPPCRAIPAAFDGGTASKALLFQAVPAVVLWRVVLPFLSASSLSPDHFMRHVRTVSLHLGRHDEHATVSVQRDATPALQMLERAMTADDSDTTTEASEVQRLLLASTSVGDDERPQFFWSQQQYVQMLIPLQIRSWSAGLVSLSLRFSLPVRDAASAECLQRTFQTPSCGTATLRTVVLDNALITAEVVHGVARACPKLEHASLLNCWAHDKSGKRTGWYNYQNGLSTAVVFAIAHAEWQKGLRTLTVTGHYDRHVLLSQIFLRAYRDEVSVPPTSGENGPASCSPPSGVPLSQTLEVLCLGCGYDAEERVFLSDLQRSCVACRRLRTLDLHGLHVKVLDELATLRDRTPATRQTEDSTADCRPPLFVEPLPSDSIPGQPSFDTPSLLPFSMTRCGTAHSWPPRFLQSQVHSMLRAALCGPLPSRSALYAHSRNLSAQCDVAAIAHKWTTSLACDGRRYNRPTDPSENAPEARHQRAELLRTSDEAVVYTEAHCERLRAAGAVAPHLPVMQSELQALRRAQWAADRRKASARFTAKYLARIDATRTAARADSNDDASADAHADTSCDHWPGLASVLDDLASVAGDDIQAVAMLQNGAWAPGCLDTWDTTAAADVPFQHRFPSASDLCSIASVRGRLSLQSPITPDGWL